MTDKSSKHATPPIKAGLTGDPVELMVLTEVSIIAHLAETAFTRLMPDGMTVAQFGILNHLLRLKKRQTIGELAIAMQVSQPTMSSTIRKLEDKGFITLSPDEADKRVRYISITQTGTAMRATCVKALSTVQGDLSNALKSNEWQSLLPLLMKLRVVMDNARN